MAVKTDYPEGAHWFRGEDKLLTYTVYQVDGLTPLDVTGYTFSWGFDRTPVLASSGAGISITGTYNPDPAVNTQRVNVVIEAADTLALAVPATYAYQFRRTNTGNITVLAFGTVSLM